MHDKVLKLNDIWRICNKIRAAIFRIKGLNLYDFFLPLDPNNNCLISESQFVSVFAGPLKGPTGLSEQEICQLADYFRVQDGRILYKQMCEVIHGVPDFRVNEPLVTGLEWEDPQHVNRISVSEERRLCLLIAKIAAFVNLRRLVLRPYFQDYELVAKNNGTITIDHFARILSFLKIMVSSDDFNLLVKKFIKDSYTINYISFLKMIDDAVQFLEANGMLDVGGDLLNQFPGKELNAELPKLPRPEIGKIRPAVVFGKQSIFHPILAAKAEQEALDIVLRRIQQHVLNNRIRIADMFSDFDPLRSGRVSMAQFRRSLDSIGLSGLSRLYLSEPELDMIMVQYRDPTDPGRVCWQTFENDINSVFTIKELEKLPMFRVQVPPTEVVDLPKKGQADWHKVNTSMRDLCENTLTKIKQKVTTRRFILKPAFKDYDKNNNGHVSRSQMRQCMSSNGLLLADEELYALEERYNNDLGFNYFSFLADVESKRVEEPLYNKLVEDMKRVNAPPVKPPPPSREKDIVMILAKIKGVVMRDRIRVQQFLEDFDRNNEFIIHTEDFKRALSNCKLNLTETEVDCLITVYGSPMRKGFVDYRRFSEAVEEVFTQACLERAPLCVPLQHVPTRDCERNFLNYDERQVLSLAMQKLADKPEMQMNLMSVFKDYDHTNCGTVAKGQFLKVLSVRKMIELISTKEFEIVCKCFSFERGLRDEVDYRAFCKTLDLLYITRRYNPF